MKMADGGFRPAYNVQWASTPHSQIIVGVEVNNCGSDGGQLSPNARASPTTLSTTSCEWLADGGFASDADIEDAHQRWHHRLRSSAPSRNSSRDPYVPLPDDSEALAQWASAHGQ